jgi:pyruvate formate lyase activating enzyme
MKICGLQKTTLVDYPGKIACTLFLYGCNFKCGFCYNADLVTESAPGIFSEDEILNFLNNRKDKLEAICITGGEPLMSLTENFLKKIKDIGYLIKMDTNGTNPEKLQQFINQNLIDYVAMDIKGTKEDYNKITQSEVPMEKIEQSIKLISNLKDYEFRTTILEEFHNSEQIKSIGKWLNQITNKKPQKYFLQGFKNKGNFINKKYSSVENTTEAHLNKLKSQVINDFELVEIRW